MTGRVAGTIAAIWRFPLKSAAGESLESAVIGPRGIPGDRGWALIDVASGHIGSAKLPRAWAGLVDLVPRFADEPAPDRPMPPIRITLPEGETIRSDDPDADARISALIGRAVRFASTPPAARIVEREWPDIDGMPMRAVESAGEIGLAAPGAFFDHAPVHLLTTASLAALAAANPETDADPRRFRPTLVIESPAGERGFVENEWTGRSLAIGDVELRILGPSPRCVVVTLERQELPRDLGVLQALVAANRIPFEPGSPEMPCLGAYAVVTRPGSVAAGDTAVIR